MSGVLIGSLIFRPTITPFPVGRECPVTLPLDPILHHPLLPNDTRLQSTEKELSSRLHGKLKETDSAVVIVVHGGQTILEWSHGRIRSNVSAEDDDRKVGLDTIWRVASITKVAPSQNYIELMKVFTVLEALVQQNKGRLSMNDDIRDYIEDFRLFDNAEDKITLRSLGSHLSGLGRDSMS